MLVKYNHRVINLEKVTEFYKCEVTTGMHTQIGIRFEFGLEVSFFEFEDEEKTNEAFEKILDSYRWQRMQCTL